MKINWHGEKFDYDGAILMSQAKVIKRHTGFTLKRWEEALAEADPDALVALVWVILDQNDIKTDFDSLDFSTADLATMIEMDEVPEVVTVPDPTTPQAKPDT